VNAATLGRDPFMPHPPKGRGPALGLALIAHALLIAALAFGVNWRNSEPTTIAAELWSAVPQAAAPRAVEPPPTSAKEPAPEVPKPEPVVKPAEPVAAPKPQAPPLPDPQIAIEKAKREALKREQLERETAEREKLRAKEVLAKKQAADKLKAEKEQAERDKAAKAEQALKAEKAEAASLAAARETNLKRMLGQAGATGGPTDTGTAARSGAPSASYMGRIAARIKPNIVFTDTIAGDPKAVVEVKLAPDGTIVSKRLVQSSGVKVWDDAVLRAIERTEVLPRDVDGRVPPQIEIGFRPRD
jgi:colicin import membrane protein